MRKHGVKKGLFFGMAIIGFTLLAAFAVMLLWNWLMPVLFGTVTIHFGQALGLLLLSKILFGGWRGRGGHRGGRWAERFKNKWEQMSEEEREKFRKCSHRGRYEMFQAEMKTEEK